jgi:hypothetical protein
LRHPGAIESLEKNAWWILLDSVLAAETRRGGGVEGFTRVPAQPRIHSKSTRRLKGRRAGIWLYGMHNGI